jgi:hypothetical protein
MKQVMPVEVWQGGKSGYMARLFFSNSTLTYLQRLRVIVFLHGNGTSSSDIEALIYHRLRDKSAHMHMRSLLQTLNQNRAPANWHYYDVNRVHKCKMNGETYHDEYYTFQESISEFDVKVYRHFQRTGSYLL